MQQSSLSNKEKKQQPEARSGGGARPSDRTHETSDKPLAKYRFELLPTNSANQKLLRLTYLGGGNFYNRSVDFKISSPHQLFNVHGKSDSGSIIKKFLFEKIKEFNDKNLRIDDTSIKRFFSSNGVPIETCGALSMDLLKAIIKTKRLQTQVGHSETAKILIDNGADVKQADKDGSTSLHGDLVSAQFQEEFNILKSKVDQLQKIDQEQLQQLLQNHRRLIDENNAPAPFTNTF
jgi:hypothetical protein